MHFEYSMSKTKFINFTANILFHCSLSQVSRFIFPQESKTEIIKAILNSSSSALLWVFSKFCPTRCRMPLTLSTPTTTVLGKALSTTCPIYPCTNWLPPCTNLWQSSLSQPHPLTSAPPLLPPWFPRKVSTSPFLACTSITALAHAGCPVGILVMCILDWPTRLFFMNISAFQNLQNLNSTDTQ